MRRRLGWLALALAVPPLAIGVLALLTTWAVPDGWVGAVLTFNLVTVGVLAVTTWGSVDKVVVDGGSGRFRWGFVLLALGLVNAVVRFGAVEAALRREVTVSAYRPDSEAAHVVGFLSAAVACSVVAVIGLVLVVSVWRSDRPGES